MIDQLDGNYYINRCLSFVLVPDGMALDVTSRIIYWTDAALNRIERANLLDGSDRSVVLTSDRPRAIVFDGVNGYVS